MPGRVSPVIFEQLVKSDDHACVVGVRVCNANMDGRDIVCVMPTGKVRTA